MRETEGGSEEERRYKGAGKGRRARKRDWGASSEMNEREEKGKKEGGCRQCEHNSRSKEIEAEEVDVNTCTTPDWCFLTLCSLCHYVTQAHLQQTSIILHTLWQEEQVSSPPQGTHTICIETICLYAVLWKRSGPLTDLSYFCSFFDHTYVLQIIKESLV